MSKRGLSDDELAVWTTVTRSVKPLKPARRAAKSETPDIAVPPSSRKTALKAAVIKSTPPAKKPADAAIAPLSRREKQRVSRGHDRVDARLDLHGHTQSEAHAALSRFLHRASAAQAKLVLIITGKSGVLRREVPRWLAMPEFRALVISADTAAIRHGGEGALYVRLRRTR